jgi:hypothetical protein
MRHLPPRCIVCADKTLNEPEDGPTPAHTTAHLSSEHFSSRPSCLARHRSHSLASWLHQNESREWRSLPRHAIVQKTCIHQDGPFHLHSLLAPHTAFRRPVVALQMEGRRWRPAVPSLTLRVTSHLSIRCECLGDKNPMFSSLAENIFHSKAPPCSPYCTLTLAATLMSFSRPVDNSHRAWCRLHTCPCRHRYHYAAGSAVT